MSGTTTVTVTEALKDHLKDIKAARELSSLNDTIQSVIDNPVQGESEVPHDDTQENPATIKVSDYTHEWLKQVKENSEYTNFEDLLRDRAGATPRDKGEQPIEWEPL